MDTSNNTAVDKFYSISVSNRSGDSTASYAVFAAAPVIDPLPETITRRVITVFRSVASPTGQVYFTLPKYQLYALCGTINRDGLTDGVQIEIIDRHAVTLGKTLRDGTLSMGTDCKVRSVDGGLQFKPDEGSSNSNNSEAGGKEGAFTIKTSDDFTFMEAKSEKYILGLGISTNLVRDVGPYATFTPQPNTLYWIIPGNIFYLMSGHHKPRDVIKEEMEHSTSTVMINFDQLRTDDVQIVHDKNGKLVIAQEVES